MKTIRIAVFIGLAVLCGFIHWRAGTYHSEFGRYSDEGIHFVTGLLIRDFAVSGDWRHPMQFAQDFYAHFPKVGLGQWPPVFETLQAGWGLAFGVSRISMLLLVQLLTVILAFLVFEAARPRVGALYAAFASALLIASPLTQYVSSMVMAEIPLALFSLLAVLAWIRFQESGRPRDAVLFGLWTTVAIMTKGNAWLIPVVVVLSLTWNLIGNSRQSGAGASLLALLRSRGLWIAVLIITAVCLPFTLLTFRIVRQGMNSQSLPDARFLLASIGVHSRFVAGILGLPLTLLAVAGLAWRLVVPLLQRRKPDLFWFVLAIYGVVIIVFHALVPSSIEPRKVYQIAPVMCLFAAGALDALSIARPVMRSAVVVAAALIFAFTGFTLLMPFAPGFKPAIQMLLAQPDTARAAILLASNPYFNDYEAALIAEWTSRRRDTGTYLLRATKVLSATVNTPDGVDFIPYDSSPAELRAHLDSIPIAYVVLETSPADVSYRHHELLRQTLETYPEDWEQVYSTSKTALGKPHEIRIFHYRKDVRGVPVRFEIDLSRKIHQTIEVGTPQQ